jgi:DNA-binding CsgD family transcriptional regulator
VLLIFSFLGVPATAASRPRKAYDHAAFENSYNSGRNTILAFTPSCPNRPSRKRSNVPQPSVGMSKQALARVQRLCCLGIGGEMVMPDLLRQVSEFIPLRGGFFLWMNSNQEITKCCGMGPIPTAALYHQEFHLTPRETDVVVPVSQLMISPSPNAVRQFWPILRVDYPTFLRSDYYNEVCRPADIHEVVTLVVREANRNYGALEIFRAAEEPPFHLTEFRMLETIALFIAHAMTRAPVVEDSFASSEDHGLFVADLGGTVRGADWHAQRLLEMALGLRLKSWGTTTRREPLPEIARLCRNLAGTAKGKVGQPPPVLRLRNPFGEFVLRAYWLEPTDGVELTRHVSITIERRVPRALALHRRLEDLPLTGREKQLCLLLAHSPSRQDLADAMGVSTGTIITYQRSIHAKLDVHSRAELLAALLPG